MALFESAQIAWHDALMMNEGMQDPFAQKVRSTKPGEQGVREAELAKIKKIINALPDTQRVAGNWCFAPSDTKVSVQSRDKMVQKVWGKLKARREKRLGNYYLTVKLTILVSRALDDARFSCTDVQGAAKYSQAALASAIGVSPPSFLETWKDDYELMVSIIKEDAMAGLTEVEKEVNKINARYRQAG